MRSTPSSPRQVFVALVVVCAGLSTAAPAVPIAPSPSPAPVRPKDNAAIPLLEAFGPDPFHQGPQSGPYFAMPDNSLQSEILKARKAPWAAGEYPRVHAWLATNEAPLARVVEATRRPRLWFPHPPGSPLASAPPFFNELRWAANALSARAMLQLRAGNTGAAWTDVLAIHRLAALQAQDGRLSSWLLAQGNRGAADETAAAVITHGNSDVASAKARLADLAAISAFPASAEIADRVVRAETLDLVSRFAVARSASELRALDMPALAWERVDWNVVRRTANGWVDRLVAIARRPIGRDRRDALKLWAQQAEAAGAAARKTLAPGSTTEGAGPAAISRAVGDILSSVFISGSFVATEDYSRIKGDLNRVALALAAHRADTGEYPDGLAELAPRFFSRLPRDPFTGAIPVYERQGAGYLLYSPGLDQKFDRERGGSGDDLVLRVR